MASYMVGMGNRVMFWGSENCWNVNPVWPSLNQAIDSVLSLLWFCLGFESEETKWFLPMVPVPILIWTAIKYYICIYPYTYKHLVIWRLVNLRETPVKNRFSHPFKHGWCLFDFSDFVLLLMTLVSENHFRLISLFFFIVWENDIST